MADDIIKISNDEEVNLADNFRPEDAPETKRRASTVSLLSLSTGGCFPPDTYSFISLFSPLQDIRAFLFGIMIFSFQGVFLLLLILNVLYPKWSSFDNSDGNHNWVPGDVEPVVKFSQYLAVLAFCVFADESIMDIVTALDMMPIFNKRTKRDNVICICVSNILRLTQGALAIVVSFLLIFTSGNVLDIVLNFTAINFISGLDEVAFDLAKLGHYGDKLKNDAEMIEEVKLPRCISDKSNHMIRKNSLLVAIFVTVLGAGGVYTVKQNKGGYLTTRLRVEFDDGVLAHHSGCYHRSENITKASNGNRITYEYFNTDENDIFKFGYCKPKQTWYFYENTETINNVACRANDEQKVLASSSQTVNFDVADTFSNPWFSPGGAPLSINFLGRRDWSDEECGQFFGDGLCYEPFNSIDFKYDGGDCCGASCEGGSCGIQTVDHAFGTELKELADGFPTCNDPRMVDIVIKINSIENKPITDQYGEPMITIPPLMTLECDEKMHLVLDLEDQMVNHNETVKVRDGAECKILVRKEYDLSPVTYEIYHQIEPNKAIKILDGNSKHAESMEFKVILMCYFQVLSNNLDHETVYSGKNSQSRAILWLLNDKTGNSDCHNPFFPERYALAVMNFEALSRNETEAEDGLWIENTRQCNWGPIICSGGYVEELILNEYNVSGRIATEVGLLKRLVSLNANFMGFTGTIPSELGNLPELKKIYLRGNKDLLNKAVEDTHLVGTIPPELGKLTKLEDLLLGYNELNGTIPSELGNLAELEYFEMDKNNLEGTIPSELGKLTRMKFFSTLLNSLSGSIPTEFGGFSELVSLMLNHNMLTGTLPSEFGSLIELKTLDLQMNSLHGTITSGLGNMSELEFLNLDENNFGGRFPSELVKLLKLKEISIVNNDLTGTIPAKLGDLSELELLQLKENNLGGTIPPELGKSTSLTHLILAVNKISGSIPSELGNLSELEGFNIRDNQVTGTIPTQLANLTELWFMDLRQNELTGPIPSQLGMMSELKYLVLDENNLTGSVPSELGDLSGLIHLHLHNNLLTGVVPLELANLKYLTELNLANNSLVGDLDPIVCNNSGIYELTYDAEEVNCTCCDFGYYYYSDSNHTNATDDQEGDEDGYYVSHNDSNIFEK